MLWREGWQVFMGVVWLVMLAGCASPLALKQSVATYDQAVTDVQMEQLLLNIARSHHQPPLHLYNR